MGHVVESEASKQFRISRRAESGELRYFIVSTCCMKKVITLKDIEF